MVIRVTKYIHEEEKTSFVNGETYIEKTIDFDIRGESCRGYIPRKEAEENDRQLCCEDFKKILEYRVVEICNVEGKPVVRDSYYTDGNRKVPYNYCQSCGTKLDIEVTKVKHYQWVSIKVMKEVSKGTWELKEETKE